MLKNKNSQGFTLAEVLITLGIIGVVAAMTIPTLIQNYNTKVWDTSANVFNRKLEEALKTMNTQQTLAGHTTTESFVEELSKHFKTNKICQNDKLLDCFSETVYWGGGDATPEEVDMSIIKTAKNFGQDDWGTNIVGVQFANGVSALIAYNPTTGENACTQDPYSNQITGGDCLAILYDTSANKNPNTSGKDIRSLNVSKLGSGCVAEVNGVCITVAAQKTTPHFWNACDSTGNSTDPDDLKFMSDYGINQCCRPVDCGSSGDYWAGAVKTCGGVSKMPSLTDLGKIAAYVYNKDSIGANEDFFNTLSVDSVKMSEVGLTPPYGSVVWSSVEFSTADAYHRTIGFNSSYIAIDGRSSSDCTTICVSN